MTLPDGLHVRPCSLIAKIAATATAPVQVRFGPQQADASSMFDLMALGAESGAELQICGDDETTVTRIVALFESDFAEPEQPN